VREVRANFATRKSRLWSADRSDGAQQAALQHPVGGGTDARRRIEGRLFRFRPLSKLGYRMGIPLPTICQRVRSKLRTDASRRKPGTRCDHQGLVGSLAIDSFAPVALVQPREDLVGSSMTTRSNGATLPSSSAPCSLPANSRGPQSDSRSEKVALVLAGQNAEQV
jgi:hypothetical protein